MDTQGLYDVMNFDAGMRVRSLKCADQPAGDHAAVFVVCLGQHKNILAEAAAGEGITAAKIQTDLLTQTLHRTAERGFGERLVFARCH